MYWTNGSICKGEWVKGIQHGYGEMSFPDWQVYQWQLIDGG